MVYRTAMNRLSCLPAHRRSRLAQSAPSRAQIVALTVACFNSDEFQTLADSTKATYRNIIQQIRDEHGDTRVALVQREHIVAFLNELPPQPRLTGMRMLMRFGISEVLRRDDPRLS